MATITTGAQVTTAPAILTTGAPGPLVPPTAPQPAAPAGFSLQGIENTVFTFIQAHYAKVIGFLAGFATSSYGLIGKLLGKIF